MDECRIRRAVGFRLADAGQIIALPNQALERGKWRGEPGAV